MKTPTLIVAFALALSLLSPGAVRGADLEKALDALLNKDYETALRELQPLAGQGDAEAQFNLGIMYANGDGVPRDREKSIEWFRLAAEQGHASSQYILGDRYYHGDGGVAQSYEEAAKWYRLAAEQGDFFAQQALGGWYFLGPLLGDGGIPLDYPRAYMWFSIAASNAANVKHPSVAAYLAPSKRDEIARHLTPEQIVKGKALIVACEAKGYKDC